MNKSKRNTVSMEGSSCGSINFANVYHSAYVWHKALKLGCVTNFDMLLIVMGLISLVDEIQFMLISSCQF